jgi:hypothetical protein
MSFVRSHTCSDVMLHFIPRTRGSPTTTVQGAAQRHWQIPWWRQLSTDQDGEQEESEERRTCRRQSANPTGGRASSGTQASHRMLLFASGVSLQLNAAGNGVTAQGPRVCNGRRDGASVQDRTPACSAQPGRSCRRRYAGVTLAAAEVPVVSSSG